MRKVIVIIAILLLLGGATVIVFPHIQQIMYRQYARELIEDFEARLEIYRAESIAQNRNGGNGYHSGSGHYENGGYENSGYSSSGSGGGSSSGSGNRRPSAGSGYWDPNDPLYWLYQLVAEYNRNLYETGQRDLVDPFSFEQVDFSLEEFGFSEEMIGYITIPRMDIELPIFLGANERNLRRGAAHLTQTSLPVGGASTNSAISAHRGMSSAAMFRDIERLQIGDEVLLSNFMGTLRYQVVEMRVIWPDEIDILAIQEGRDLITLITCHPYRQAIQRYVVFAERVI